ncbi:MAG: Asp-tRNA(Asn)/Glu-tRNA(Gln) amidotransferase subunit GatB [Chloroflexi bacterium]|nr:Asp-tRNA(Asn)/Glu-tRNA(Gln) amidotransferase subunit GatB [Chloroflexota bacterium]
MEFEPVIGLEIHAELQTKSKMFCACPVVDPTEAEPNIAVCPVCAGMPGVLPVVNQKAVEYAIRVALALNCEIAPTSIFARKNYFYPDLHKGYQISQYEQPLAVNGSLKIFTSKGEKTIRIRRVHMEEDTGKLTHVMKNGHSHSLVDLNRAGVPLLEIVSEPDLRSAEEVRAYAQTLRSILRYLGVNSGDMQKGVMRIEPNVSVRPVGSETFGTRTEIKNLNSFRALERSVDYEIRRQIERIRQGKPVIQQTLGWDESRGETVPQRSKEDAHDYRYFPEPDLPPLVVEPAWIEEIRASLPELPYAKVQRFRQQYGLSEYDADVLVAEPAVADYYEQAVNAAPDTTPKMVANWLSGELFSLLNQSLLPIEEIRVSPQSFGRLLQMVTQGKINQNTAKAVLEEMFNTGKEAQDIVSERGLSQISDADYIASLVSQTLDQHPEQVSTYLKGKETVSRWLFGQVMRLSRGQANPHVVQQELDRQLAALKEASH